jgi:hypothetical protein
MAKVETEFLRKNWNLDYRAELYKAEFFATPTWRDPTRRDGMVNAWNGSTRGEVGDLLSLRKVRDEHVGAISQEQYAATMIGYWYELLKFTPSERPRTNELLHACVYLAGSVATFFKARFNRARPSILAPDLSPPIPVPGLPSYPGGHSTQMHLMALVLTELAPRDAEQKIRAKAQEVALNRERAGLNYSSDTTAGCGLAVRIFEILKRECPKFMTALQEARAEW